MTIKKCLLFSWFVFSGTLLFSQQTTVFTEANASYKIATDLFDQGLYGKAQEEFKKTIDLLVPASHGQYDLLIARAELGYAQSAVRLELPDGEKLMLEFIRTYSPDPISNQALIELANFYYNSKKYEKAVEYFAIIPTNQLTNEQRSEVRFKMGYAYFVKKQFPQAKANFSQVKDLENEYYYPTNYYLGLCYFFDGDYDKATKQFQIVQNSRKYKPHVPYYIAQIYFAEGEYQKLIDYAEPLISDNRTRKRQELHQLIGQSYFELGQFEAALPYLEYYAERSGKLREEEFYQLGYTQYKNGKYESATNNLEQLADQNSELGQFALYYLGDSYLNLGKKTNARNAFGLAQRMNYNSGIRQEAKLNYAKLSYELGYGTEAITTLQTFKPGDTHYGEAQNLMGNIFLNTRDYEGALSIIDEIPEKTPQIREAYQKVAYLRGMQLYQQGDLAQAAQKFSKSNSEPVNQTIKAACTYWLGDIAHQNKKYQESAQMLDQFLTLAKTVKDLPDESSIYTANYIQGYNYLKQQNYARALGYFQETVSSIERNKPFIRNQVVKEQVLGDATLRAADCFFKRNEYNDAIRFYNSAINNNYSGFIYALYQKAIIEGLRGKTTEKILALESIIDDYPRSEYADDALFALGVTYQEIGQLNQATQPLRQLVQDYKNSSNLVVQSLLRLGLISFNQGNLQTAVEYYKQIFGSNPEPAEARDALAALEEIYVDYLSDPDGYTRFLETIPGYEIDNFAKDSLNFKSAESQYENSNYERAIQGFTDYIRKFPNGVNLLAAHQHRGESFYELKRYAEALGDFEYVVARGQSKYYQKSLQLSALIAYNYSLDFNKAYDYYKKLEQAALTEEMRFEAQLGALQSAYRINNTQAVYEMANKVSSNPNATQSQKAKANFYLGKVAYDNKDYGSAQIAFNQVSQYGGGVEAAEARYLLARIAYLKRDLVLAEDLANKAIQGNAGYDDWVARALILLSDVYADSGDLFNAKAVLEAVLDGYKGQDQTILTEARSKLEKLNQAAAAGSRLDSSDDSSGFEMDDDDGN
ncbi:MAG: tetratricopeptide repeat protein [Saprospiraceae bacterium]|nr:tetratricopeptide repeat protein [Saprospiraceae bacterium]